MQINLKQPEIIAALKQFVSGQGFALAGKTVDVKFTAGRGESGLSADISIEEVEIPGTAVGESEPVKPVLSVVPAVAVPAAEAPAAPVDAAPAKATTSLFN